MFEKFSSLRKTFLSFWIKKSKKSKKFLLLSGDHITNINHALKSIKSDVVIDFIRSDHRGLIVVSNKIMVSSDMSIINNYIKNSDNLDIKDIQDV